MSSHLKIGNLPPLFDLPNDLFTRPPEEIDEKIEILKTAAFNLITSNQDDSSALLSPRKSITVLPSLSVSSCASSTSSSSSSLLSSAKKTQSARSAERSNRNAKIKKQMYLLKKVCSPNEYPYSSDKMYYMAVASAFDVSENTARVACQEKSRKKKEDSHVSLNPEIQEKFLELHTEKKQQSNDEEMRVTKRNAAIIQQVNALKLIYPQTEAKYSKVFDWTYYTAVASKFKLCVGSIHAICTEKTEELFSEKEDFPIILDTDIQKKFLELYNVKAQADDLYHEVAREIYDYLTAANALDVPDQEQSVKDEVVERPHKKQKSYTQIL